MSTNKTRHFDLTIATTAGGIPYRLMGGYPQIQQSDDGTKVTEQYLLKSSDASAFAAESLPPPIISNGIGYLPPRRAMPNSGYFITRNISFKPHSDELVWDPMAFYVDSASNESFDPYCLVDIEYETSQENEENQRDVNDPVTFLERSMTAGMQWLSLPPQKVMLLGGDVQNRRPKNVSNVVREGDKRVTHVAGVKINPIETIDNLGGSKANPNKMYGDDGYGKGFCSDAQGNPSTSCPTNPEANDKPEDSQKENKDYELPVLLPIQTVEYNLRWNMALNPPFGRMFRYIGRVNSDAHPLFWNAKRETVLFMGMSASQKFVWNGAKTIAQPWTLDLKFSQQIKNDRGLTYGWNHVIVPETGEWQRLFRANGQPLHYSFSIKRFFK